jgi:flavin-dependent dehydrogenase
VSGKIRSVAILGGGPAAGALAVLLARKGIRTAIFRMPKPVAFIAGESTVPAIVPILRMLGVEDEVRGYSELNLGATVNIGPEQNFNYHFDKINNGLPGYAYNVPRDRFDATLLNAAHKSGVEIIEAAAQLEKISGTDKIKLSDESFATSHNYFSGQPDLIVDATGGFQVLSKLLDIVGRKATRRDTVLFAHVDRIQLDFQGLSHITRLDYGWSWRIPLPGRLSVGVVIPPEHLPRFGTTPEECFDNLLQRDSVLSKVARDSKRLTPVMEQADCQRVSERIIGDGWVLLGDTAGFIDPVFSGELLIGMQSAVLLAGTVQKGSWLDFHGYEREVMRRLEVWHGIVDGFYDGRLFNAVVVGERLSRKYPLIFQVVPGFANNFGRIFTGAASDSPFRARLMRSFIGWSARKEDHAAMKIR